MDVEPSDGIPDLGSVWQSGGGPLCFSRVIPVPTLVLPEFPDDSGHRCVCPPMPECQSVCVSANKADSGSTMCILHIVFCTVCKYVLSICKLLCFFFLHRLEHARKNFTHQGTCAVVM